MTKPFRLFAALDHLLPSGSRLLCPIAIALAGCATEDSTPRICDEPSLARIDRVVLPANIEAARTNALDLDNDHVVDNQLGMISSTLHGQITGFDLSAAASERLATEIQWHLSVSRCDANDVDVALVPSSNDAGAVHMTGTLVNGRIVARGEDGILPMSTMFDPDRRYERPGWLRARIASVDVRQNADGNWEGRLAMAFDHGEVLDATTQPMAAYFTEHRLFMGTFDTSPTDGTITPEELENSMLVKSLLSPDLERDDQLLLSFGIGFSATSAR